MSAQEPRRTRSYTPWPQLPAQLMPRLAAIVQVLAGMKNVSQAAREVSLSRNHFQSILHRSLLAMIESLAAKPAGRRAKPALQTEMQRRMKQLERENARLKKRVAATDQLLEVTGDLLHGRQQGAGRQRRVRKSASNATQNADDAEEPHGRLLAALEQMHRLGLTMRRAATLCGYDASTVRRWRTCAREHRCVPRRALTPSIIRRAGALVRDLHGLIGAGALSHSIAGLTRRAAAAIKVQTLTAMERERKAQLGHVYLTQPGVMRGLDAMYFATAAGPRYALIGADACVAYRTAVRVAELYDAPLVAELLEEDIRVNGAPLVLRADRARAHDAPRVKVLLERHQILMLHGPPRYPCFYGQLERQNREHRAWLASPIDLRASELQPLLGHMLLALNTLWRRRSLHWKTAAEVWNARPPISLQTRCAFRAEVHNRTRQIACGLQRSNQPQDLAERLAIEQTLEHMGYLRRQIGARC